MSVPYAVSLFQGTQLFNRELTIKPRINNNSNVQQRVEHSKPQQSHPATMRNPFDAHSKFSNDASSRLDRSRDEQQTHGTQYEQSSLRSGFVPIPTKASTQMQPQPSKRLNSQQPANALNVNDLNKLMSLGATMLQPNIRQLSDISTRPAYDMLFADKGASDRHSSNLKMTSRHNSRSHYRDEPYSRRDPPRQQQRGSGDRRRR